MKVKAAVIWAPKQGLEVTEVELDPPKDQEVLVKWMASGLCHSDYHSIDGISSLRLPVVGGHEGAGIVLECGSKVTRVKPGDHFVASFIPSCGHCRWCSTGHQNLCDVGRNSNAGTLRDETYRFHARGEDLSSFGGIATFAEYSTVSEYSLVKIRDDIPFEPACLVGCGVPTGWGSAVIMADVEPGEIVVVYGVGGVGMNAVQGARIAGAKYIIAVDPQPFKREKAPEFGATHVAANYDEVRDIVFDLTNGVWADKAIITVGNINTEVIQSGFDIIRKGGTLVLTGAGAPWTEKTIQLTSNTVSLWKKRIQGALAGGTNLQYDILRLLDLYMSGDLKLDELITRRYKLEDINQGYKDMIDGKNIRGIIVHDPKIAY